MLGITNVSNAPSIVLKDTIVSTWTSGSYNGYSYRGTIPITGVTANTIAEVTFSQSQAESGNYSSVCTTYDGGLYIYSKVNTSITIPSIIIHSIVETYYEMENSPVSGSTKAVTSGGVFDAIRVKTFTPTIHDITVSQYSCFRKSGNVVKISFSANIPASVNRVVLTNIPIPSDFQIGTIIDQNDGYKSIGYCAVGGGVSQLLVTTTQATQSALLNIVYLSDNQF